jgi:hypothetical protein
MSSLALWLNEMLTKALVIHKLPRNSPSLHELKTAYAQAYPPFPQE